MVFLLNGTKYVSLVDAVRKNSNLVNMYSKDIYYQTAYIPAFPPLDILYCTDSDDKYITKLMRHPFPFWKWNMEYYNTAMEK